MGLKKAEVSVQNIKKRGERMREDIFLEKERDRERESERERERERVRVRERERERERERDCLLTVHQPLLDQG